MRDAIYRVIQVYGNTDPLSSGKRTILDRNILYGVIQKRFGSRRSKSRVQNDLRFHDAPLRRLTSKLPLVRKSKKEGKSGARTFEGRRRSFAAARRRRRLILPLTFAYLESEFGVVLFINTETRSSG